jgi:hypothetical protein
MRLEVRLRFLNYIQKTIKTNKMLSTFAHMNETDKKIFVAKIIHNMNYSQSSFDTMDAIVKMWEQFPIRPATFFTQKNQLTNGITNN